MEGASRAFVGVAATAILAARTCRQGRGATALTWRPSGRVWPDLAKYLLSNTRGLESSSHPQRPCLAPRHAQGSGAGQPPGGRAADREPVWREHRYQTRCMVLGDYWCARLPLARRPPTACPPPARLPPLPLLGGQAVAAPTKPGPRFELSRAGLSRSQRRHLALPSPPQGSSPPSLWCWYSSLAGAFTNGSSTRSSWQRQRPSTWSTT